MKNNRAQRRIGNAPTLPVKKNAAGVSVPVDFRRRKLFLALWIMAAGMLIALICAAIQGWVLGKDYPYNTFLFSPDIRFSDLSGLTTISSLSNPYIDPTAFYPPFAWLCLRLLSPLPDSISVIGCFFISLAGLFLLLVAILRPVVSKPSRRVLYSLLLMGMSYPVLFCFDRGNIEIVLAVLIASAIFFMARANHVPALLCIVPAMCLKVYPAFFLVLLLRQRKVAQIILGLLAFVAITFLSLYLLSLPLKTTWELYNRNLAFYAQSGIYENLSLEGTSPWNAFKIALIAAGNMGLIQPVDFSFDAGFIRTAYAGYAGCMILLAAGLTIYACLLEKQFARCAMALLLFLAVSTPAGGDYRLLYASIALILLVVLKTKRPLDIAALILLALTMVPKKEIILTFAGHTDTVYSDVSIEAFLDPILVLTALGLLLYDSRTYFDLRWTNLRLNRLIRAILPRLPEKSRSTIRPKEGAVAISRDPS